MSLTTKRYTRNGTDIRIMRQWFKTHVIIFKYVKEPWEKGRKVPWTVAEFEQGEVNNNNKKWIEI